MSTGGPWLLEIDWLGRPHLSNAERRMGWRQLGRIHETWREAGAGAAMLAHLPQLPPCAVIARARYKRLPLPDAGAIAPTVKCVLDGLVDWGCWPDDTPAWVLSETMLPPTLDRTLPDALLIRLLPA